MARFEFMATKNVRSVKVHSLVDKSGVGEKRETRGEMRETMPAPSIGEPRSEIREAKI